MDKEDEPPLRKLEFGMHGETVVSPGPEPPMAHMINRGDKWFIPYRYDSSVVNEDLFRGEDARPGLRAQFGEGADGADRFFRLVFGYCAGNPEWQSSSENRVLRGRAPCGKRTQQGSSTSFITTLYDTSFVCFFFPIDRHVLYLIFLSIPLLVWRESSFISPSPARKH